MNIDLSNLKDNYLKYGYAVIKSAFPMQIVNEIQEHIKILTKQYPKTRPEAFHHDMLVSDPFIHHILKQHIILNITNKFIGKNSALFGAHYIAKRPHDGKPVGWHQDGSYWPLKPMNVISLWIAGTSSNKDNGCMRVIPGSQNKRLIKASKMINLDPEKYVLDLAIKDEYVDSENAKDLELSPGDISIHNPNIIHGSNPNFSNNWRIGLTLRLIPTTTYVNKKKWECIIINGKKTFGINNNYKKKPLFDLQKHMKFKGFEEYLQ